MSILAIIPARGGSRGIPGKNLQPVGGVPLVGRAVDLARRTPEIARTVVSTDSGEIEAVALSHGAEIIRRPPEISGDTAASELALLHALDHLERAEGYEPEILVFLQCTSPLTAPEDVSGTLRRMMETGADTAFAAVPSHWFLWRQTPSGEAVAINHEARRRARRQEREPEYVESGAVYAMRVAGFRRARHRFFGKIVLYATPAERWLEIDEPGDLPRAELALERLRRATP